MGSRVWQTAGSPAIARAPLQWAWPGEQEILKPPGLRKQPGKQSSELGDQEGLVPAWLRCCQAE